MCVYKKILCHSFFRCLNRATMEAKTAEKSATIHKPETDKREYRVVTLKNGLKCALVHDSEADKVGAAMNVGVGYFADPTTLPGLAHFLEHMLFFSSKKYPKEGEFTSFLSLHGGSDNAYTQCEHTVYHFDVMHEHLTEALDRWAQFFIGPLFSPDATNRELHAVHNEHLKNLKSQAWRSNQLTASTVTSAHPFSKFSTGNMETLRTRPEAAGIDVRQALVDFYHLHYRPANMRLAVYGRESLDELEKLVMAVFSSVRAHESNADTKTALDSRSSAEKVLSLRWMASDCDHLEIDHLAVCHAMRLHVECARVMRVLRVCNVM